MPPAELGLIDAQKNLNEYIDSFDDVKIDKKVKFAINESSKEINVQKKETKIVFNAINKDKTASIKSERLMMSISKSHALHSKHHNVVEALNLHKRALKKMLARNFALPKQIIYEFDAKLAQLTDSDSINALTNDYIAIFDQKTKAYLVEMTSALDKIISKLNERKGKENIADQEVIIGFKSELEKARSVYNDVRNETLVGQKTFMHDLNQQKQLANHEAKKHHLHTLRTKARQIFEHKSNLVISQIKDKNVVRNKKEQLQQKFARIDAYNLEEKQLIKSFESIKAIYQVSKMSKIRRYFILKNLLLQRKVISSLVQVGLKPEHAYRYPHEFSGGQKQRINIARALILEPQLIIADEPIASLDISIQAQVINILIELVKKKGISMIFIGHDLSVIEYLADSILVMHLGRVVEKGLVNKVFKKPLHPYTKTLFASIPKVSTANEPFKSVDVDLSYISDYMVEKPSYKIVAPDHLLLANTKQLKK